MLFFIYISFAFPSELTLNFLKKIPGYNRLFLKLVKKKKKKIFIC